MPQSTGSQRIRHNLATEQQKLIFIKGKKQENLQWCIHHKHWKYIQENSKSVFGGQIWKQMARNGDRSGCFKYVLNKNLFDILILFF